MGGGAIEERRDSWLSRLVVRRVHPWITLGFSFSLVIVPLLLAYLEGFRGEYFSQGYWRLPLLPAAIIVYILVVASILARGEDRVVEAFRSLVILEDDAFDRLVSGASTPKVLGETAAFSVGGIFGTIIGQTWLPGPDTPILRLYLMIAGFLMFALLGWVIYVSVAGTRLTTELHRQPLRIDILDVTPFEPMGRQSLAVALVFVGGIALSIVLGGGLASFSVWQNWIIYPLLAVVPVVVFFLNMRDTHRVLSAEKRRELKVVQEQIVLASRDLMERLAMDRSTGSLGAEISALVAYEKRIQSARTWPYNTAMLRTLFVSVVVPGCAAVAGFLSDVLF
jgi:hypothetical protein